MADYERDPETVVLEELRKKFAGIDEEAVFAFFKRRFDLRKLRHVVEPGETLSGIANKYGVRVAALGEQNAISDLDVIYACDIIFIDLGD